MSKRTFLRTIFPAILLAPLFSPSATLGADAVFSGNLLFVTPGYISVRLSSGMVIDARLPKKGNPASGQISAQFKLADQVELTCRRVDDFDEQADRYYQFEAKMVRFLRPASPDEKRNVAAALFWQGGNNLLEYSAASTTKPDSGPANTSGSAAADPAGMEHIRVVNLANIAKMPNFVADEKATRSRGKTGSPKWSLQDVIESEIIFQGSDATRQHIRINGKAWKSKSVWLPGLNWGSAFGSDLSPVFDKNCVSGLVLQGREEVRGRQLIAYRFQSPPDGCFGPHMVSPGRFNPPRTGRILVDDPGGNVIQFEKIESGFPAGFGFSSESKEVISWDYVKIGETAYLLPVAADYLFTYPSGDVWHIEVQYMNHRRFEASVILKFGEN